MNTLFAAVEAMRGAYPGFTLRQAILFLYVCENEGLSLHELAFISRLSDQTASRGVKILSSEAPERIAAPLLRVQQHPSDRRILNIYLSERGVALKDEISGEISRRCVIATKRAA